MLIIRRSLILGLCLLAQSVSAQIDYSLIASRIIETYETSLVTLPLSRQEHFSLRMYRTTGHGRYKPAIQLMADHFQNNLRKNVANIEDQIYIKHYLAKLKADQKDTAKGRLRRESLSQGNQVIFFTNGIVYPLVKLQELNISLPEKDHAIKILRKIDFKKELLKPSILRAWAAPTVNWIFWLYQLGVVDLRNDLKLAFAKAFPMDGSLEGDDFVNQLYGLTHFIIAASEYYQSYVEPESYQWILDFFEKNQAKILTCGNPDIIAEVGVNFLIAKQYDHPLVGDTRNIVAKYFDQSHGIILAKGMSSNMEKAEHRNVLAYLLFRLPMPLYKGPDLEHSTSRFRMSL